MDFLKNRVKDIIILILGILLIISYFIIVSLNDKKEPIINKEVIGKVIVSDKSYVIIETPTDDYHISNIKGSYQVGDEVKFNYFSDAIKEVDGIKNININDEEIIRVNYKENNLPNNSTYNEITNSLGKENIITDDKIINAISNDNYVVDFVNKTENLGSNLTKLEKFNAESIDDKVLTYFNDIKDSLTSSDLKTNIKSKFVIVIDFVFYNGKINGYTFNELSASAKLKVLTIALYLDDKIENYFPGYKETISNNTTKIYTNIKERIVTNYLKITTAICAKDSNLCIEAKNNFTELKTNFNLTWKLLKSIASDGINSLKNWYEIWRGK